MVKATLAKTKFQTRRIMKGQPYTLRTEGWGFPTRKGGFVSAKMILDDCPYGKPGDRLWVREATVVHGSIREQLNGYIADGCTRTESWEKQMPSIHMRRSHCRIVLGITDVRVQRLQDISEEDAIAEGIAPLFDEQERLAVGCNLDPMPWNNYLWHGYVGKTITTKQSADWPHQFSSYNDPVGSYSSLWESINGKGSWELDPFVWCISFKVI